MHKLRVFLNLPCANNRFPPPSKPRQYRAIGLVRGKYQSDDLNKEITRGNLLTENGQKIEAVLLGRVISLVKNHLDLEKNHLWVVYPRIRQENDHLHFQIVGVWEPETLSKEPSTFSENLEEQKSGYFSVRGEVIFYTEDTQTVIVKIRQSPKKESEQMKFFKLKLKGNLEGKPLRHFWDFHVQLQEETMIIEKAIDLGPAVLKKKRKTFKQDKDYRGKFSSDRSSSDLRPRAQKPQPVSKPKLRPKPKD